MTNRKIISRILLLLTMLLSAQINLVSGQTVEKGKSLFSMESHDFVPLGIRYTKAHPVVVVADWDFVPFSYCDNDGKPAGYIPDIIEEIFGLIHIPYQLKMMDPLVAKNQLAMRKADMMLDVCKQDEIGGLVYGNAVFGEYPVSIARGKKMKKVCNICDFSPSDTVYFCRSDYADDYVQHTLFSSLKCHTSYLNPAAAIQRMAEGEKIYYVWGTIPLRCMLNNWELNDVIALDSVNDIVPGVLRVQSADHNLLDQLDLQQVRLNRSGRYAQIQGKWFKTDETVDFVTDSPVRAIAIVVVVVVLILAAAFCVISFLRVGSHPYRLSREFHAINDMASAASGCKMLVLSYKSMIVRNAKCDILPEAEMKLQEFEKRIHPKDLLSEYALRNAFFNGAKCPEQLTLRIRSRKISEGYFRYRVYTSVRYSRLGKPVKLYMALVKED